MSKPAIDTPSAADPAVELADWLELVAIQSADRSSSIVDLIREIGRSGTIEAVLGEDADERSDQKKPEAAEVVAESAFSEVSDRAIACRNGTYPFEVHANSIQATDAAEESPYIFMLLVTRFGLEVGPSNLSASAIFEDLSARAAESYFGGPQDDIASRAFGFPRRYERKAFPEALDEFCSSMGEGVGHRPDRPRIRDQKDGKLDVVVWRDFPDHRQGKLIGFGQCAAGKNWPEKTWELQPEEFCRLWMRDTPLVQPTKMFFIPRRIDPAHWLELSIYAGIMFDRCRIANHIVNEPNLLTKQYQRWSQSVIRDRVSRK